MKIEQFEDKGLAHYSYAILSEQANQVVLIDPSRNLAPYLAFAEKHGAAITAVIETHPHADFVSGHLELHKTKGATIYCSNLLGASYPHKPFDEGDAITLGEIKFKALNTPGHSPDSISIVLQHNDVDHAVFTGDTLFIGDCGRPDLRENVGQFTATREELASQMYTSLRDKLMVLGSDVLVYPAHGAGSLCGKGLSQANYSTIGAEKISNWSLRDMDKADFITALLEDQPFIPKYFPYDVELNKNGAPNLAEALQAVSVGNADRLNENILVIDTRTEAAFKKGHLPNAINLQNGEKFETWLGSIVTPGEAFYLLASNETELNHLILRCTKIGYEAFIEQANVHNDGPMTNSLLDIEHFKTHTADYTIVDIRNDGEVKAQPVFENAIAIPLPELRERVNEIPLNKPIVVHCAGGYRSAAGSSIVANTVGTKTMVYDLSEAIKTFI